MPSLSATASQTQSSAPTDSGVPPSCFSFSIRACNAAPTAIRAGLEQLVGQAGRQRAGRDGVDVDVPNSRASSASVSVKRTMAALEAA